MYNVSIYDDALVDEDNKIQYGGAGKLINLHDICQQYNLTEEEDQEKIGPTEPVVLGPKVILSYQKLTQHYISASRLRNLWTSSMKNTTTHITCRGMRTTGTSWRRSKPAKEMKTYTPRSSTCTLISSSVALNPQRSTKTEYLAEVM